MKIRDINELISEMEKFQCEELYSNMSINSYVSSMNVFYTELKRLSYENYDDNGFSTNYIRAINLLTDIEWNAPIHYICNVINGFQSDDFIITEIIIQAYNQISYGESKKSFDFTGHCGEAMGEIRRECQKIGIEHQTIEINPFFDKKFYSPFEEILGDSVRHYASLIMINDKKYLVDITYRQFFMINQNNINRIGVPYLNSCNPGFFMLYDDNYKKIAKQLINFGWIEATDENLKAYFDGFAISFRNGIFYENMKKIVFKTDYRVEDYISFLNGNGSQLENEQIISLGRQMRPMKKIMKF